MCGGGPDLPAQKDPKEERLKAEADATTSANAKAAEARRMKQRQSLLAAGATNASAPVTSTVLAQGKAKLGA